MPDHVHLFIQTDHLTAPVTIASTLKSISAVYLFSRFPTLKKQKFWGTGLWNPSTYYGTVGDMTEAVVKKYIENQKTK
jgi:putative transposase